jgi:hypothetical protein
MCGGFLSSLFAAGACGDVGMMRPIAGRASAVHVLPAQAPVEKRQPWNACVIVGLAGPVPARSASSPVIAA